MKHTYIFVEAAGAVRSRARRSGLAGTEAAAGEAHGRRRAVHAVMEVQPAQGRVGAVVGAAEEGRARRPTAPHTTAGPRTGPRT